MNIPDKEKSEGYDLVYEKKSLQPGKRFCLYWFPTEVFPEALSNFFEISGILEVNDGKKMVKESIYIKYRIYI